MKKIRGRGGFQQTMNHQNHTLFLPWQNLCLVPFLFDILCHFLRFMANPRKQQTRCTIQQWPTLPFWQWTTIVYMFFAIFVFFCNNVIRGWACDRSRRERPQLILLTSYTIWQGIPLGNPNVIANAKSVYSNSNPFHQLTGTSYLHIISHWTMRLMWFVLLLKWVWILQLNIVWWSVVKKIPKNLKYISVSSKEVNL